MQQLSDEIINQTFTQAINLQIGDQTVGAVEEKDELVCQCGSTDFLIADAFELHCSNCGAVYKSTSESEGRFEPLFLCECGSASVENVDGSGLCACTGCGKLYIHVEHNDTFMEVDD
jgi:hypothetical protein